MAKISLSPYTIRVTHRNSDNDVELDNLKGSDLLKIIKKYLRAIEDTASINEETSKVIKLKSRFDIDRTNSGIFETGEFGYETELYDTKAEKVTYSRKTFEAELIPFYYLISIPRKSYEGIIILQRFKQFGIKNIFLDDFNKYFNTEFPDYKLSINPLVAKDIINQYFNDGRVTKVRFISFHIPKNIEDIYAGKNKKRYGYIEKVFSLTRGQNFSANFLQKLKYNASKLINSSTTVSELVELQEIENFDNLKLEIKIGNSNRVVDLGAIRKIRFTEDITSKVKINRNGHPTFDSIDSEARSLLSDLSQSIWVNENVE